MSFQKSILTLLAWAFCAGAALAAAPTISNFSPTSGAPGTQVTINGANFINGTTTVQFGNMIANVTLLGAGQIVATVPVNAETGVITVSTLGGFGQSTTFTVSPRIDDFTPAIASVGGQVTIFGANFISGGTTIKFGTSTAVIVVTASTQIAATVPAGATTGPIKVSTFAGTNSSATNFIVAGTGPVITDFTPSLGVTNSLVVINGGDFTTVTNVTFNNTNATFSITAPTQIHAFVPTNATTGLIRVKTPTGTGASSSNFVVTGLVPFITGFTPVSGKVGDPVVIDGLNFTTVTNVTFNGSNATFSVTSDTQLTAFVPANAKTGPLRLVDPAGSATTTSNFFTGPLITDFSPVSGAKGSQVLINGVNFTGATNVSFNGASAAFVITADNQLTAFVPTNATTGPLRVTSPAGTNTTSTNFSVTASAPVLTDFTPTNGLIGTTVLITGANFTGATNVTFNGTNAVPGVTSDTQISVVVPGGATTGVIRIFGPGGSVTSTNLFYLPPQIVSLTPTNGVVGAVVTITGTNFTGTTSVTFAGTNAAQIAAAFTITSQTQLSVVVPTNAITGALRVTAPGGVIISTNAFFVTPRVDSFTPTLGPVGTVVTVGGLNFLSVAAVRFNGVSAAFTVDSPQQITVSVPAGAGTGPISITTADGFGASATNFIVTVASDLVVTQTFSPAVIILGGTVATTVVVTNKGPSIVTGVVLSETLPAGSVFLSASSTLGICGHTNGVITCNFGVVSNGVAVTVLIISRPTVTGQNEFRALATAVEGDANSVDNFSSIYAPVISDAQRTLAIQSLGASREVVVSWPISAVTFQLQFNTNLFPAGNVWLDVPTPVSFFTNMALVENHVTNSATEPRQFFRLKSP